MDKALQSSIWRLRRAAAGVRQLDICLASGISQARYSMLERGEATPTKFELGVIDKALPSLAPELLQAVISEKEKRSVAED